MFATFLNNRDAEFAEVRRQLDAITFCDVCGTPTHNRVKVHSWCRPAPETRPESGQSPEVIRRDLAATQPIEDDAWNPELSNGVCCHCGERAQPEFLLCDGCRVRADSNGPGGAFVAIIRKAVLIRRGAPSGPRECVGCDKNRQVDRLGRCRECRRAMKRTATAPR